MFPLPYHLSGKLRLRWNTLTQERNWCCYNTSLAAKTVLQGTLSSCTWHNVWSIVQCKYPELYKHALISPVPKVYPPEWYLQWLSSDRSSPAAGKVLKKLQLTLNRQDLKINNNQHAFTKGRLTVSALASISQKWFNVTDNSSDGRLEFHALFLDFRKAFDMVDLGIVIGDACQQKFLVVDPKFSGGQKSKG